MLTEAEILGLMQQETTKPLGKFDANNMAVLSEALVARRGQELDPKSERVEQLLAMGGTLLEIPN
ncbi:MAG: hypothetical protein V1487_00100 [bacterium]